MLPQPHAETGPAPFGLRGTRLVPPLPRQASSPANGAPPGDEPLFGVEVLDNPVNTYEEVIAVCLRALPLTTEEAFHIAYTIDRRGSCVVCVASHEQAEQIAATIRTIGIDVSVTPWETRTP